ncbi:MAG: 3'(2'),5'-bisphosphate nucleotidase CysQ [Rhodobacteraceae bacterium]|nr:3'(2'),5'-bisphosphate nucleotidase CysQ [Paracoccaceae bacterium]
MNHAALHDTMVSLVLISGYRALESFRTREFVQNRKPDNSLVTSADLEVDRIITAGLQRHYPAIPVLSEEGDNHAPPEDGTFFLVDPIDGTNGFANGNPQFTINIAYLENCKLLMGAVYAPAVGFLCHNDASRNVYGIRSDNLAELIMQRSTPLKRPQANANALRAVISGSAKQGSRDLDMLDGYKLSGHARASSSLKFNMLVAGEADVYARRMETSEWDTAAGHAILLASGGVVLTADGAPLTYGKPGLRNPGFIALAEGAVVS